MERKSVPFELKDIDKGKRIAVIAHAVYNNIDRVDDISRKGMFTKSWNESKDDIAFYLNHNDEQAPGKVVDVYEDQNNAYTKAWLGTHTLGNDTLIMMDEGVIKNASFGYIVEKSNRLVKDGRNLRELTEVKHLETSVLTKIPANPKAGVRQIQKTLKQIELKQLTAGEQKVLKAVLSNDQDSLAQLITLSNSIDQTSDLYTTVLYFIQCRIGCIGDLRGQIKYNGVDDGDGTDSEDMADMSMDSMKSLKEYNQTLEKFIHNTKASDECIKSIQSEHDQVKQFISKYDTASTRLATEPVASKNENDVLTQLLLIQNLINS